MMMHQIFAQFLVWQIAFSTTSQSYLTFTSLFGLTVSNQLERCYSKILHVMFSPSYVIAAV